MQRSEQPHIEVARARVAIAHLGSAASVEAFGDAWNEYLHRLERIWSKLSANYRRSPKWDSWQGKVVTQRRVDPLLSYLVNARGVEEHGVSEIVNTRATLTINEAKEGEGVYIPFLGVDDGVITVVTDPSMKVDFSVKVQLAAVVNRGRTYSVPASHIGNAIDPTDIVAVAEAGLTYYQGVLAAAEHYFTT